MLNLLHGDCLDELPKLGMFHGCVTDPPYGLKFMGRDWDHGVPGVAFWQAVYAQLLPGAHLIAFGGTRTHHRLMCAIEDAGFEIRDTLMWMYGSGFAKGRDIERAIDIETCELPGRHFMNCLPPDNKRQPSDHVCPSSHAGDSWGGWGTCVKPSYEPIILARKPLQGTVAANVLKHGCGGLNVDACRVDGASRPWLERAKPRSGSGRNVYGKHGLEGSRAVGDTDVGRWPANVIHDGSDEVLAAFARFGESKSSAAPRNISPGSTENWRMARQNYTTFGHTDTGTAARFFPCCPWSEDELRFHYSGKADGADRADSKHPTVKPVSLMRWLVKLITPPSAHILDPFAGSGTTGEAAMLEGFDCTMIERDAKHAADIARRIKRWSGLDLPLFSG